MKKEYKLMKVIFMNNYMLLTWIFHKITNKPIKINKINYI
jgi:hypothetical protein